MNPANQPAKGLRRRKSLDVMFDGSKDDGGNDEHKTVGHSSSSEEGRRRSATMPPVYAPQATGAERPLEMFDLHALSKSTSDGPLS